MGLSCKPWGKTESLMKKLEYRMRKEQESLKKKSPKKTKKDSSDV